MSIIIVAVKTNWETPSLLLESQWKNKTQKEV